MKLECLRTIDNVVYGDVVTRANTCKYDVYVIKQVLRIRLPHFKPDGRRQLCRRTFLVVFLFNHTCTSVIKLHIKSDMHLQSGWRFGLVVTRWPRST